jgi:hypothetical protein
MLEKNVSVFSIFSQFLVKYITYIESPVLYYPFSELIKSIRKSLIPKFSLLNQDVTPCERTQNSQMIRPISLLGKGPDHGQSVISAVLCLEVLVYPDQHNPYFGFLYGVSG